MTPTDSSWAERALREVFASPDYQALGGTGLWDSLPVPIERAAGPWLVVAVGTGGAVAPRAGQPLPVVNPPRFCCVLHYPDRHPRWELSGGAPSWPQGGTPPPEPPAAEARPDPATRTHAYCAALSTALELGAFADAPPPRLQSALEAVRETRRTLIAAIPAVARPHYAGALAVIDRWIAAHAAR